MPRGPGGRHVLKLLRLFVVEPIRFHFWGSFAIVLLVSSVLAFRITDRRGFADGELHRDVMERWGAPIRQPMPSVRYVPTGAVFNALEPLPLTRQEVKVDAAMNYRKRGLVYFSGFDFRFTGDFETENPFDQDVDVAFVFPIAMEKNRVLLSELAFTVNGAAAPVALGPGGDKLLWTGRLKPKERLGFRVAFKGRGLDAFTYVMDPSAAVRNVGLSVNIRGGDHYDYADGVVPATSVERSGDAVRLAWRFDSLESGIPIGVVLPSERSFDSIIATCVSRSWAGFLLFFAGLVALCLHHGRPPRIFESYLFASAYALFFVLVAYLAAYVHFYVAWVLALAVTGGLLCGYAALLLPRGAWRPVAGLVAGCLAIPTLAVILQGYTGLIYTLESLALIATLMVASARPEGLHVHAALGLAAEPKGADHVA
jgi:hypothetical protein